MLRSAIALLGMSLAAGAAAQTVVTSPAPESVDVTVYRDPTRPIERAPDLTWLNGFALISETRTVSVPAGETSIRFEGVAGGILPQSAIVTGFPEGIVERNRDAYLLSPATLLDRSLGRRVHLRRTSRATGAVREQEAIVTSGANGAVVLQTEDGFEALRCTGVDETIVYDAVPPSLSARPTLSVRARSQQPVTATITLSYLASGFDWQANYVASLSPDEERVELFAWLTLANGDETSFAEADTQAVAGRLNRDAAVRAPPSEGGGLSLRCWPSATTSMIAGEEDERVVVTGSRVRARVGAVRSEDLVNELPQSFAAMQAAQEELGDLKLYRIPEPVTVAARSQKQVALLQRPGVRVDLVYRRRLFPTDSVVAAPANRVLVSRNREREGLGLPLPAGRMVLFSSDGPRPILLGEGSVRDLAIGEEVEVELGPAPGVLTELRLIERRGNTLDYELEVSNDRDRPVRFEAEFAPGGTVSPSRRLGRRDGMPLWAVTLPANGRAILRYQLTIQ